MSIEKGTCSITKKRADNVKVNMVRLSAMISHSQRLSHQMG
jgi:hypothetical protein